MKMKIEMEMDYDELMARFEAHYIMDYKFYDFRFAFEKYVHEERKINHHNMENLVAFGLTLEYFGMKNIEILS